MTHSVLQVSIARCQNARAQNYALKLQKLCPITPICLCCPINLITGVILFYCMLYANSNRHLVRPDDQLTCKSRQAPLSRVSLLSQRPSERTLRCQTALHGMEGLGNSGGVLGQTRFALSCACTLPSCTWSCQQRSYWSWLVAIAWP